MCPVRTRAFTWDTCPPYSVCLHWQNSLFLPYGCVLVTIYNDLCYLGTFLPLALKKRNLAFLELVTFSCFQPLRDVEIRFNLIKFPLLEMEGKNVTSVLCS